MRFASFAIVLGIALVTSIGTYFPQQKSSDHTDGPYSASRIQTVVHSDSSPPVSDQSRPSQQDRGTLVLCGGGQLPNSVRNRFFQLGGGPQGRLVLIPTASEKSDRLEFSNFLREWSSFDWESIEIVHFNRSNHPHMETLDPFKSATAVWISGGDQNRLAERMLGTDSESSIHRFIQNGGVIGGTSAGTAIASRVMIGGGEWNPILCRGLDLFPNTVLDQHFSARNRFHRLETAVNVHPDRVGLGIDEGTALVVGPKTIEVIGDGNVYVYSGSKRGTETAPTKGPRVIQHGFFGDHDSLGL